MADVHLHEIIEILDERRGNAVGPYAYEKYNHYLDAYNELLIKISKDVGSGACPTIAYSMTTGTHFVHVIDFDRE